LDLKVSGRRVAAITGFVFGACAFVAALFMLGFLAGGVVSARQGNNGTTLFIRNAAVLSTLYYPQYPGGPFGFLWNRPFTPLEDNGPVTRYDRSRSSSGANLLVTSEGTRAELISMTGEVLHSWSRSLEEVWPDTSVIPGYRPGLTVYWRRVHLYPNGDILAVYESPEVTPYGLGLVKLDKDSNVLWKYADHVHHDISVGPDGRIYVLFQEISTRAYMNRVAFSTPYLSEGVAVLDRNGKLIKKVYLLDAIVNSDRFSLLNRLALESLEGDFMHMNTVQYIGADVAAHFPFTKPGQLLVSMREMKTIAVLDLDREQIVWNMDGLFHRQHEPQLLPTGNILVFDNLGHNGAGEGASRIVEFNPLTQALVWKYTGTVEDPLESQAYGSEQRLANGNTLIVESMNGRVIEVTPDKQIVWQYRVTHRRTYGGKVYIPVITDLVRFPSGSLNFLTQ